jgi:hypothetical protein
MTATRNTPENAGRRKLFIVLPNLAIGGAERVAIDLMRSLSRARFEIILVLLSRSGSSSIKFRRISRSSS